MDSGTWLDLVKLWGPLSLGWAVAAYLGRFIMERYDRDIQAKVELATAINQLTKMIESHFRAKI